MTWPRGHREPVVVVTRRWPTEVENELRRRCPAVRLSIDDTPMTATSCAGRSSTPTWSCPPSPTPPCGVVRRGHPNQVRRQLRCRVQPHRHRRGSGRRRDGDQHTGRAHRRHRGHCHDADADGRAAGRRGRAGAARRAVDRLATDTHDGQRRHRPHARDHRHGPDRCGRGAACPRTASTCRSSTTTRRYRPRRRVPDARRVDTVEEVLEQADFVSLHLPGGADNKHLINAARLARMRPDAFLINTARGDVVDTAALAEALGQAPSQAPVSTSTRANRTCPTRCGPYPTSCCSRTWAAPPDRPGSQWASSSWTTSPPSSTTGHRHVEWHDQHRRHGDVR